MLIGSAGDRIRRLRAVSRTRDTLALRLSLERTLGRADVRPRRLSPQTIVCVRRLRLPMPRAHPDAWTAEVGRAVEHLLPHIVRPFREAVPADAAIVVFADEAELLACLARDWVQGHADAWWWQGLFGGPITEDLVRQSFSKSVAAVPIAIEHLVEARIAAEVLRQLPDAYCAELAESLSATFAVPDWTSPAPASSHDVPPFQEATRSRKAERRARLDAALAVETPLSVDRLMPSQRSLLALAILLRRDPALARRHGTAALVRTSAWRAQIVGTDSQPTAAANETYSTERDMPAVGVEPAIADPPSEPSGGRMTSDVGHEDHNDHTSPVSVDEHRAVPDSMEPLPVPIAIPAAVADVAVGRTTRPNVDLERAPATYVESAFVGILYLVNLAIHLGLYGDFTQPAKPGLDLPLGDFLALVGERVCGNALHEDPLWGVLAELSGRRPEDLPGGDFEPPESIPLSDWLDVSIEMLAKRAAPPLGVEEAIALTFLCARAGRVFLSATRLDAVFPLATHPIEIRCAGLDRNPGWVPAAGRVIELHYE